MLQYGDVPGQVTELRDGEVTGDGAYHVFVNTQEELKWKIVTGVSMDFIAFQVRSVNRLLRFYLYIGMIMVVGLTLFFSLRRYTGIKKVLLSFWDQRTSLAGEKGSDEYHLLMNHILRLKERGDDYRIQMEELARQNEAILLEHLITIGGYGRQKKGAYSKSALIRRQNLIVVIVRSNQDGYKSHEMISSVW